MFRRQDNPAIIVLGLSLAVGAWAAWHYAAAGLTLAHYDARGHLVVARRVSDSLTPGWRQFGALWLPLPHLLNALPVLWASNFQSGASAVAFNIAATAIGIAALFRLVLRRTDSLLAAGTAAALVQLQSSLLYLESTSMTEPLLFGLSWLAVDAADRRLDAPETFTPLAHPGRWLALAVLTRYEAWPLAALVTAIIAFDRPRGDRFAAFVRVGAWPAAAAAAFLLLGRLALGRWMADAGFFTPDNPAAHQPLAVLGQILDGGLALAGPWTIAAGTAGAVYVAWRSIVEKQCRPLLVLAFLACAALPFAAFFDGHPYRVRYMLAPTAAACAAAGWLIAAVPARLRAAAAGLVLAAAWWTRPPIDPSAPMVVEAQRERPAQAGRVALTDTLARQYDGRPILVSMNGLGHYLQELSRLGLPLRDFIHEGNGDLWQAAIAHPDRHAGWVLIEEQAEGGDTLAWLTRQHPEMLAHFALAAEGGGARLYKRASE